MKQKNTQFIQYQDSELLARNYGQSLYTYVQTFKNVAPFDYQVKLVSGKVFNFKISLKSNTQIAHISSKEEIRDEYFSYTIFSQEDEIGFFNNKNYFHFYTRRDTVNTDNSFETELSNFFYGEKNILRQYDIEVAKKKAKEEQLKQEEAQKEKEIQKAIVQKEEQELKQFIHNVKEKRELLKSIKTFEDKINYLLQNYEYVKTELTEVKNFTAFTIDGLTVFEYITKDNIVYRLSNFEELSAPKKNKVKESKTMEYLDASVI